MDTIIGILPDGSEHTYRSGDAVEYRETLLAAGQMPRRGIVARIGSDDHGPFLKVRWQHHTSGDAYAETSAIVPAGYRYTVDMTPIAPKRPRYTYSVPAEIKVHPYNNRAIVYALYGIPGDVPGHATVTRIDKSTYVASVTLDGRTAFTNIYTDAGVALAAIVEYVTRYIDTANNR